ncbi:MAG: hypothetical protein ACI4NE_00655 [Succinivibrio sp.]
MFGFSFSSLVLLLAVALVILGPKETFMLAVKAGDLISKVKRQFSKFKRELNFIDEPKAAIASFKTEVTDKLFSDVNLSGTDNHTELSVIPDTSTGSEDAVRIDALLERLDDLEKEIRTLKDKAQSIKKN